MLHNVEHVALTLKRHLPSSVVEDPGSLGTFAQSSKASKISSAVSLLEMSYFKLCNVSVKKRELIDCQDKIQKRETIIINASN